jgi:hypothetical protein
MIKKDEKGLYVVADNWIARPDDTTEFSEHEEVDASCETNPPGGVIVEGALLIEVWEKTLPVWWHPVEGQTPENTERRQRDLERSPEAFTALNEAFERGEIMG